MKVVRSQVFQALEATRNRYLFDDRAEEAATLDDEIGILRKVPGDDLDSMAESAERSFERYDGAFMVRDLRAGWPSGPITLLGGVAGGLGGGAGGFALSRFIGISEGWTTVVSLVTGLAGMALPMAIGLYQENQAGKMETATKALKRHRSEIVNFSPEQNSGSSITVEQFAGYAKAAENDYLLAGKPSSAARIARVAEFVNDVGEESLVEAFNEIHRRSLDGGRWRERLDWIETTPELPDLLLSMSQVERVNSVGDDGLDIEFEENSVTIGSVVLPHN